MNYENLKLAVIITLIACIVIYVIALVFILIFRIKPKIKQSDIISEETYDKMKEVDKLIQKTYVSLSKVQSVNENQVTGLKFDDFNFSDENIIDIKEIVPGIYKPIKKDV